MASQTEVAVTLAEKWMQRFSALEPPYDFDGTNKVDEIENEMMESGDCECVEGDDYRWYFFSDGSVFGDNLEASPFEALSGEKAQAVLERFNGHPRIVGVRAFKENLRTVLLRHVDQVMVEQYPSGVSTRKVSVSKKEANFLGLVPVPPAVQREEKVEIELSKEGYRKLLLRRVDERVQKIRYRVCDPLWLLEEELVLFGK